MVKNSDGRAEIIIALDDIPAEQLSEETVAALVGEPLQMSEPIPVGSTPTITETLDMEPGEDGNTVVTVIADGDESSDGADVLTVVGGKIVSNNKRTSGKRIIRKTNNTAAETPTAEVFAGMENTHVASAQEELTAMLALSKLSTQPLRSLMMSEQLTLNSAPKQPEFDMSIPATFPQLSTEQTQQ
jgi:hypothetical protein